MLQEAALISHWGLQASVRSTLWCVKQVSPVHAQEKILQEAALSGDSGSAAFLCDLYKEHTNADGVIPGNSGLSPDLRGAAYIAAVTQPDGCQLSYGEIF